MAGRKRRSIYGNRDPREIPAYPIFEAARYLGSSEDRLRGWIGAKGDPPLIKLPADSDGQLSFFNLVEAFVILGLRTKHGVSLQRLRKDIEFLESLVPASEHPLADLDLATFAKQVFVDGDEVLNVSRGGQLGIQEVLRPVLERVEKDIKKGVLRLYPFTRPQATDSPKLIVIDPAIAFGQPTIAGTGVPTRVIRDRWKAGESIPSLAEDYDRSVEEIEEALRYEAA